MTNRLYLLSYLFLFSFLLPNDVCLYIDNGNLNYLSTKSIYGFQFDFVGDCANEATGGDTELYFTNISNSLGDDDMGVIGTIIAFSIDGHYIPAGEGVLLENINCESIQNFTFSDVADENSNAPELNTIFSDSDCSLNSSIIESNTIPATFTIKNIYPNPFNPSCDISYTIFKSGYVKISLFDILGKELSVPINSIMHPGNYNINIDGSSLTSGIYFVSISHNDQILTQKITLIK